MVAALLHGPLDGLAGDLVEHHPLRCPRGGEHLAQVPGDRLPLAVLVRGQVDLTGLAGQLLQLGHLGLLLGRHDVDRLEAVVDVDGQAGPRLPLEGGRELLAGGEVADVADRRLDHVLGPEQAGDGLGLGRRLDDHQLAGCPAVAARRRGVVGVGLGGRLCQVGRWHRCGQG